MRPDSMGTKCGNPLGLAVNWGTGGSENVGARSEPSVGDRDGWPGRSRVRIPRQVFASIKQGARLALAHRPAGEVGLAPGLVLRGGVAGPRPDSSREGLGVAIGMGRQAKSANSALARSGARWTAHPKPDSRLHGRPMTMVCCVAGHSAGSGALLASPPGFTRDGAREPYRGRPALSDVSRKRKSTSWPERRAT